MTCWKTYIRESRYGASVAAQVEAARAQDRPSEEDDSGKVYIDRLPSRANRRITPRDLPARAEMLKSLGAGETVWVHTLDRLGLSGPDLQAAIEQIGSAGGAIFDGTERRLYRWSPEVLELAAAVRTAAAALVVERTKPGRDKVIDEGLIRGQPSKRARFTDEQLEAMEREWHDPAISPQGRIAAKWGLSVRTLVNWFGPRFPDGEPAKPDIGSMAG